MRTAAQKANGHAGGEMGQMAFTIAICKADPSWLAVGIGLDGREQPIHAWCCVNVSLIRAFRP